MSLVRIPPKQDLWNEYYRWRVFEVAQDLGIDAAPEPDQAFLEGMQSKGWDLDHFHEFNAFVWFFLLDGEFAAGVQIRNIRRKEKIAEITYGTRKEFRGKRVVQNAVANVVDDIFSRGLLHKIVAYVRDDNEPSSRVLERLGFHLDGVLRKDFLVGSRYVDMKAYRILSSESRNWFQLLWQTNEIVRP